MNGIREWTIDAPSTSYRKVKSLCWQGDSLIDWVAGGQVYHLDGTVVVRHVIYAYRFDSAVISPSGEYAVIYEKLGTKGLILKNGEIVREINRSFYHAYTYEYPIAVFRLPDGREVIAHCPEEYCQIEIDELETGKRLTELPTREPVYIFYSRLSANNSGTLLISAGWVWHPSDVVSIYNVEAALKDARVLDGRGIAPELYSEISNAVFLSDNKLVVVGLEEAEYEDVGDEDSRLLPNSLAVYDLDQHRYTSSVVVEDTVGTVMAISDNLVVGFYEHPKLIDLNTGKTLHRWPELKSGKQRSSILWSTDPVPPPIALYPAKHRFAVASETAIHVVEIDPTSIPRDAG